MAASPNLFFSITLISLHVFIFFINKCNTTLTTIPSKFSTIIVFGDSTVDTRNNNYINTLFKGNHLPYGQDFPNRIPSGRFSNGKLVPDFVSSKLGIKDVVPPFLDPTLSDNELLSGVSFASGGSGYDDLTTVVSKVIPVSKQIELFRDYVVKIKGIVGEEKAKKIINGALVIISAGTNDFGFNFYDLPTRRLEFNISGYHDFLQTRLQSFIKDLYDLGCRSMIVSGLPPIGCLPIQMTAKFENPFNRRCLEDQNSEARSYNQKLKKLLHEMEALLPRSRIVYADIYQPLIDMIDHPHKYGFVETKRGCCGSGLVEASLLCNPTTPLCKNPLQYIFWDSVHPTELAYIYLFRYLENEIISMLL